MVEKIAKRFKIVRCDIVRDSTKELRRKVVRKYPGYRTGKVRLHRCITTNGVVKNNGELVMGRGCAGQARDKWPNIAIDLGKLVKIYGNRPFMLPYNVTSFPTKWHFKEIADQNLIKNSFNILLRTCLQMNDPFPEGSRDGVWHTFLLPKPGCKNGRLSWDSVSGMLEHMLWFFEYSFLLSGRNGPFLQDSLMEGKKFIIIVDREDG